MRPSHLYVLQLFRTYGPMTDGQAYEVHQSLASEPDRLIPNLSPSGLRSRRAELCPPRGEGLKDSGRKLKSDNGHSQTVWEVDE